MYYPDPNHTSELLFADVDLKVIFISVREYRYYTKRTFLVRRLAVRDRHHFSSIDRSIGFVYRPANLVQSSIGPISIGPIMVLRTIRNRFSNYSVMFVVVVHSMLSLGRRSFTAVQV